MKSIYFFDLLLALTLLLNYPGICYAQNPNEADSVSITLDEIVVEGRTQRTIKNGVEYIPGKKILKASSDAVSLLSNLQIPQITVSPDLSSITTLAGDEYSIFINYVSASKEDLSALRPEDVIRVEVLDYPQNPRFKSANHVINFIMIKYEWGGYTKLSLSGKTLSLNGVSGGLYEKFSFKEWGFDVVAFSNGDWNNTTNEFSEEKFHNITYSGKRYKEIKKSAHTKDFHSRNNSQFTSIRAAYSYKNNHISHTLSFNRDATPKYNMNSEMEYSIPELPSTQAITGLNTQNINVAVIGDYQFSLKKGNYIQAFWKFNHSANRHNSSYTTATLSPIVNNISERSYNPDATIYYSKDLGHDNMLRTLLSSNTVFFKTRYKGSNLSDQNLISSENMLFLSYMQNWGFGLSLYSRAGISYVYGRLNGKRIMSKIGPRLGFSLQYYINSRHNVAADGWWYNSVPLPSLANDAMYQSEPLLWIKGNPDMKQIYGTTISASYNFIPDNRWNLSASVSYTRENNMPLLLYTSHSGIDGLVRTFSDKNDEEMITGKIGASVKLLNNSLAISSYCGFSHERLIGMKRMSNNVLTNFSQASYFIRNFSFSLYYVAPEKSIIHKNGMAFKEPSVYGVKVTYSNASLNVSLAFRNWFNDGNAKETFHSPAYSLYTSLRYNNNYCKNLTLTITYTIPYGKKIEHNDNLKNEAENKSAILTKPL